ncbi:MAG: DUF2207 domain-containing protein [Patescibacteria group bacterium]|nr:DUF2207 domain-containing protein [Patescibacteria group bacterium]
MKKLLFSLFFIVGLLIGGVVRAENIKLFKTDIEVNPDSSINVVESINYDFGSEQKHGIFRDIKIEQKIDATSSYRFGFALLSVTDVAGQKYDYTTERAGDYMKVKIGDADKLVTGQKDYIIKYKINGAINNFSDHDELYWNATGDEWEVPIEQASASVRVAGTAINKTACYFGTAGSIASCVDSINKTAGVFSQSNLAAKQGMTIVAGWPKDFVTITNRQDYIIDKVVQTKFATMFSETFIGASFLFFLFLIIMLSGGLDTKSKNPIVAQYSAPSSIRPSEARFFINRLGFTFSAEIISLAVGGYLKIERIPKMLGMSDYNLIKLKDVDGDDYQAKLSRLIFEGSNEVKLTKLRSTSFSNKLMEINRDVTRNLKKAGYLSKDINKKAWNFFIVMMIIFLFVISSIIFINQLNLTLSLIVLAVFAIVIAILTLVFFFCNKLTETGADMKNYMQGLKLYLTVAEKDRLEFHNAPEKNPAKFEELLPYAIALGVEKKWTKQFDGILRQNPSWYSDPTMTAFNVVVFSKAMSSFSTAVSSVSAAAGGSGFSGGSAGGGGGGGGGGSW